MVRCGVCEITYKQAQSGYKQYKQKRTDRGARLADRGGSNPASWPERSEDRTRTTAHGSGGGVRYPRPAIVEPRAANRGARYVSEGSWEAGLALINYGEREQKKARTLAGLIGSVSG